jgi:hypothetical protein
MEGGVVVKNRLRTKKEAMVMRASKTIHHDLPLVCEALWVIVEGTDFFEEDDEEDTTHSSCYYY